MLIKRMTLDGIAAYKFLLEGKPLFFWKVFLAHMALYRNFISLYKKRQFLRTDKEKIVKYHGNILVGYFIEGRKIYSKINKRQIKT